MQKKTVQFDQLQLYFLTEEDSGGMTEHLYDLGALFRFVSSKPLNKTKKRINRDFYIFHVCLYDAQLKIWELQILHLREKILPGIADGDGAYELIQLGDGQYPAETTTFLYDETRCTLYMQRNIFGISIKTMEIFLKELSPENTLLLFKPKMKNNQINKIVASNLYRKLILIADTDQLEDKHENTTLSRTLKNFGCYQGKIVKIEMGFGRQRTGFLKSDATSALIHEAYSFNGTQMLKVRLSDPDDVFFETINLLDDRASYSVELEYSREHPITHARLFYSCLSEYTREFGVE